MSITKEMIIDGLSNNNELKSINTKINIHKTNPNQTYSLVDGKYYPYSLKSELLTDGSIEFVQYLENDLNDFIIDPTNSNRVIRLRESTIKRLKIENAKYAIIQGLKDDSLKNISIFTEIEDLNELKKIIEISNKVYKEESNLLTEDKPYVRKLTLK